jgi:hypothetical protein
VPRVTLESGSEEFCNNPSSRLGTTSARRPSQLPLFQRWSGLEALEGQKRLFWVTFPTEANKRRYCHALGPESPRPGPSQREH